MNTNQITSGEDDIPSIHLLTLVDSQEKTIETAVVWQNLRKTYRDVGPSNYVLDSRQLFADAVDAYQETARRFRGGSVSADHTSSVFLNHL